MNWALAAILTALVETVFFRLCGYKEKRALILVALVNLLTNLAMNLLLGLLPGTDFGLAGRLTPAAASAEAAVVACEYLLLAPELGRGRRLLILCLIANCLTLGLGLILARLL